MTRRHSNGDGDDCPVVAAHGAMYVLQGYPGVQYCPDQSHDGVWANGEKTPATPRIWPLGYRSFASAVAQYEAAPGLTGAIQSGSHPAPLPDLDLGDFHA